MHLGVVTPRDGDPFDHLVVERRQFHGFVHVVRDVVESEVLERRLRLSFSRLQQDALTGLTQSFYS